MSKIALCSGICAQLISLDRVPMAQRDDNWVRSWWAASEADKAYKERDFNTAAAQLNTAKLFFKAEHS